MKRFFFMLSAVVVSLTMAAQMQVWSNGTIIFSHDHTDVDSISFNNPLQVQTNYYALTTTSLAGSVYTNSLAGLTSDNILFALFFLDENNGYYGYNKNTNSNNGLSTFTYVINGNDITLTMGSRYIHGKVIGKNGLVFTDFVQLGSGSTTEKYPMSFITINR